jgi:hypothetical protein
LIHLDFSSLEATARKFDLKLVGIKQSITPGNFPHYSAARFVHSDANADLVLFLEITEIAKDNRMPGKYSHESMNIERGFDEEAEAIVVELTLIVNNTQLFTINSRMTKDKLIHREFSETLFKMIQPLMAIPKALNNLWSMFDETPQLIEPKKKRINK